MKISWFDRIVMAVTPVALLAVGFLTAQAVSVPAVAFGRLYTISDDSPLFRCDYHGNQMCTPEEVEASGLYDDREVTISLTGDPLTNCYTVLAAAGYADSLAGPMCRLVEENLG